MTYDATIIVPLLCQVDDWLQQSVSSALHQTAPTEVLVVRSNRTPPSNIRVLDRLQQRYANLSVLVEDKPGSFPGAINTGIRHASTERVGLLMSDDWLDESAVAECLLKASDIVSTGNKVYFADGRINERACKHPTIAEFHSCLTLEQKASYLQHFFLFRKQSIIAAGGVDESIGNYPGIDDFHLIWTLLERGATVSIVKKSLYHYRDHDGERLTLQSPMSMAENLRKILRKHRVTDELAPDIISRHARWYGKPIYRAMALQSGQISTTIVSRSRWSRQIKDRIANYAPWTRGVSRTTTKTLRTISRTSKKAFQIWNLSSKPWICILADKPDWAYDISARQLKRQLAHDFNIEIRYSDREPELSSSDYDLLHVCFWGESHHKAFGFDRRRIIKEVSSHRWLDDPRFGPCTPEEFAKRYLSDCDTVICTSRRLTGIVEKVFPRTFYTPNGVDIGCFGALDTIRRSNLAFGWAGNINDEVKGFWEFVEPACRERFELIAAKGELTHRQMAKFYRKVDIFVVASRHEGEPLTLLEAMASGCFPVCVDVGIVPELVKHKENGYIVPERSVEAFRQAFEWCDNNHDQVHTAGLANARLIARERNWGISAQFYGHVYRDTLEQNEFNPNRFEKRL
jgi:glycosyltransferase involved in cell wall biosynthesis